MPCRPVQALALPELMTMACATPRFTRSMQTFTGAAQTWLVVNMPATVAGTSETMSARSRFWPFVEPLPVPSRLMSQNTPLARKPCGATIEPLISLNVSFHFNNRNRICGRAAKFSNLNRVNFQPHHADVNFAAGVQRMFGQVTLCHAGNEFLAQIFRHALGVRQPCRAQPCGEAFCAVIGCIFRRESHMAGFESETRQPFFVFFRA